ncbi:hypothetical protein KM176_09595 [Pseudooceanicola sp. CBS1P-1]|uniref:Uncharacterized protein n=1 Tax=Pseudooceanicola albus TaxID=2692189 RepID=A0A6L7G769_9RHOB|nr:MULTISPECIES: DUF6478 family protein [Pseudooceanicola]MBT9384111.1 hypothetical protein [Pseudooceanicola endophyticus]MXN19789.1 hypothetical protein [Pseudooceanicola albus]
MAGGGWQAWRDNWVARQELALWQSRARAALRMPLGRLRRTGAQAHQLRAALDEVIHAADSRLALPLIGSRAFPFAEEADRALRPAPWRGPIPEIGLTALAPGQKLGEEVALFHDCPRAEIVLRQLRSPLQHGLAPFALRLEVFGFAGSFLSLVVDLPSEMLEDLGPRHVLQVDAMVRTEAPLPLYVRLNLCQGPNTDERVQALSGSGEERRAEFDLGSAVPDACLAPRPVERAWIDIIFATPGMNGIDLCDLVVSRRLRAAL